MIIDDVSSWRLDQDNPVARIPPRALDLQDDLYRSEFDYKTVFYDVFHSSDKSRIVFIGPPLLNLLPAVRAGGFELAGRLVEPEVKEKDRVAEIWLPSSGGSAQTLTLSVEFGKIELNVSANFSNLFEHRRVIVTKSKNNNLCWIRDWAQYYSRIHDADGILFYDNGSDLYELSDVEGALRLGAPDCQIVVVSWNFPWGRPGVRGTSWDSDFCQYGILQHARWRFLDGARAVLSCDIDELIVRENDTTVFGAVESSQSGKILIGGEWIQPVYLQKPSGQSNDVPSFANFGYRQSPEVRISPTKWAVVPSRCPARSQWKVHTVSGMDNDPEAAQHLRLCHFRSTSTGWKYNRDRILEYSPNIHALDKRLISLIMESGMKRTD